MRPMQASAWGHL